LDAVFLTHGHADHIRELPRLIAEGFRGPIYATGPTKKLARLSLNDAWNIQKNKYGVDNIPYSHADLSLALRQIEPVLYGQEIEVNEFKAYFGNARHMLGSGYLVLAEQGVIQPETIVFSGDQGRDDPTDILKEKEFVDHAEIVVMETTYGDKNHPVEDAEEIIAEEFALIEKSKGTLLIPAFSIQRTQRVLRTIKYLKESKRISENVRVVLDSPMAIQATRIFESDRDNLREDIAQEVHPFLFEDLIVSESAKTSEHSQRIRGPKAVITSSGMLTGGRAVIYAKNVLEDTKNRILLTGYQAEGTLGRQLQEQPDYVRIDGETRYVNAAVTTMGSLSGHVGKDELRRWLNHIDNPRMVVLVHGEDPQRKAFAQTVFEDRGLHAVMTQRGEVIDLRRAEVAQAAD
jgi:metallo-beta-lactamase family protein